MKRSPDLRGLSQDHHHGLVLARRTKQAAQGGSVDEIARQWSDIELKFRTELEPHFQFEENLIAPELDAAGEVGLAARLRSEHAALREMIQSEFEASSQSLLRFAEMLEAHIRFEENEFFEVAQKRMSPDALRKVREAWEQHHAVK